MKQYSFSQLNVFIERRLKERGLPVEVAVKPHKTVDRSFVRFPLDSVSLSERPGQKLHIKVEVDNRPPPIQKNSREEFFIARHNEVFPIVKHGEKTLFAGKVRAILLRPQILGRDCYDLIWYLQRKTECDLPYLNAGLHQAKKGKASIKDFSELLHVLNAQLEGISGKAVLEDIGAFLEDPTEADWIKRYPEVLDQLTRSRMQTFGS